MVVVNPELSQMREAGQRSEVGDAVSAQLEARPGFELSRGLSAILLADGVLECRDRRLDRLGRRGVLTPLEERCHGWVSLARGNGQVRTRDAVDQRTDSRR